MRKILVLALVFVLALLLAPKAAIGQQCGGIGNEKNACLCNPGDESCCETEGSGGYNCGCGDYDCGGGDTGGSCPGGYDKNGNCKTGGGGGSNCFNAAVSCPTGTQKTNTLVNTFCSHVSEPVIQDLCSVGSAQVNTGTCCSGRNVPNDDCHVTPSGKTVCGSDFICNGNYIETYSCAPICTATAPSAPTLTGPSDGAVIVNENSQVNLTWNAVSSFGTSCSGGTSQYRVYVTQNVSPPTNWVGTTTGTTHTFTGTPPTATYYWFIRAHNGQLFTDSEIRSFTVNSVGDPWWQVKDGDVSTSGDLTSPMPPGFEFNEDGPGGFPGLPVFAGSTADFSRDGDSNGVVSSRGWIANSTTNLSRIYDKDFFENLIPEGTAISTISSSSIPGSTFESGGTESHGYYWYRYDGSTNGLDLRITSDADLTTRKVILIIDSADLILDGRINLDDGQGFFLAMAGENNLNQKGNIHIGTGVGGGAEPHFEGLYLADNTIYTGNGNIPLYVRGSMVGYSGISLQRDLDDLNNTTPAEYFEYAPDQIMLFPSKIGARRINWKEVAP